MIRTAEPSKIGRMASLSADDFMARVLEDEGWQSPLDGSSVEAVIARYEALLPPEATVTEARGERMRHALDVRVL